MNIAKVYMEEVKGAVRAEKNEQIGRLASWVERHHTAIMCSWTTINQAANTIIISLAVSSAVFGVQMYVEKQVEEAKVEVVAPVLKELEYYRHEFADIKTKLDKAEAVMDRLSRIPMPAVPGTSYFLEKEERSKDGKSGNKRLIDSLKF